MSMRAGVAEARGNELYLRRAQNAGPGTVNIPQEVIDELGGIKSVETVRDTPDLTFSVESLDMSTFMEALTPGVDPTSVVAGDDFDFNAMKPIDFALPFRNSYTDMTDVGGVITPYMMLESVQYRFG